MSSAAVATSPATSTSSTVTRQLENSRTKATAITEFKLTAAAPLPEPKLEGGLNPDLRRILTELAKTGSCLWLPWNADEGHRSVAAKIPGSGRASITGNVPSRKKHRNGILNSRRRLEVGGSSSSQSLRKRPFVTMIRNSSSQNSSLGVSGNAASSAASVGSCASGRTSGSELDDSTQAYECDSEGTSATTNSELSAGERSRRKQHRYRTSIPGGNKTKYRSMREALRSAIAGVLDYSFRHRGYKVSLTELRKHAEKNLTNRSMKAKGSILTPEDAFAGRRKTVLSLLGDGMEAGDFLANGDALPAFRKRAIPHQFGPPFTIQRLAEVLVAPERYYTQTHKLCNCLEKLLLVTSSIGAFGGSSGGETSQTRREAREMAALASEKDRLDSERRNRRLRMRRRSSSASSSDESQPHLKDRLTAAAAAVGETKTGPIGDRTREALEASAKSQLQGRFAQESNSAAVGDLPNRRMTNSPPPPSLASSGGGGGTIQQPSSAVTNFIRQFAQQQDAQAASSVDSKLPAHLGSTDGKTSSVARAPSPILGFNGDNMKTPAFTGSQQQQQQQQNSSVLQNSHNLHMLQFHHAAALAGIPIATGANPSVSPFDNIMFDRSAPNGEGADRGSESGRSSASNSDVDSESGDDVSLEDSASDRSDDSTSTQNYEPLKAARMMALNRIQQQRLQASRLALHGADFRPPADHEYQSSDSIDSLMAEDSGGSDSSSSDLAD